MPKAPAIEHSEDAIARARLLAHFVDNPDKVFYSRQLEILFEREHFHWVTNRALRALIGEGTVLTEARQLSTGSELKLVWHKSFRFYKRAAGAVYDLVDRYSRSATDGTLGLQGEHMVLAAFARRQYVLIAEHARSYRGKEWTKTGQNLDFIFEKDGRAYGIEVKNTLGYMEVSEFADKTHMALELGLIPIFACRSLPRTWISALQRLGGYAMIMGFQFFPWAHRELAEEMQKHLLLPVDTPKRIESGTMQRFENYFDSAQYRAAAMSSETPDEAKIERVLSKLAPSWMLKRSAD